MNCLLLAAAGSGKTTHLCKRALSKKPERILIVTYTDENEECIKDRLFQINGYIPENVEVLSWFSFLLKHGVRPYQGKMYEPEIKGMILVNEKSGKKYENRRGFPVYYPETDTRRHYFNSRDRIYSDKIAKFAVKCIDKKNKVLLKRLAAIYDSIYIDEAQDLAGYDLEFIKQIMSFGIPVTLVADPRQTTYKTHYDDLYKKYNHGNIDEFLVKECIGIDTEIDTKTLATSFRNNAAIIEVSSALYPQYQRPIAGNVLKNGLDGVFFIDELSAEEFAERYNAMQLRPRKDAKNVIKKRNAMNIGKSKGREFDNVLLFPTKDMINWLLDNDLPLAEKTRAQFYVALTRARYCVCVFLPSKEFNKMKGVMRIGGISLIQIK
jgi:DNA helicase II / ATP-dependent DNA helicase PcrA